MYGTRRANKLSINQRVTVMNKLHCCILIGWLALVTLSGVYHLVMMESKILNLEIQCEELKNQNKSLREEIKDTIDEYLIERERTVQEKIPFNKDNEELKTRNHLERATCLHRLRERRWSGSLD